MPNFSISFEELTTALTLVQSGRMRIQEEIRTATVSMNGVRESEAFTGLTKQGIDLVISNQHIPILKGVEECYRLYEQDMRAMMAKAREHMNETDDNAVITQGALEVFRDELNKYHEYKEDFDNEAEMIYNSVSDYLDIGMPSSGSYHVSHSILRNKINTSIERINTFSFDWSETIEFKNKLDQEITRLDNVVNRPFDSLARVEVASKIEFRNAMIDRIGTREEEMIAKATELFQLWQTMTPREAFMSMSNPPSEEEMTAWYMFVDTFYDSWTPEQRQFMGGNQIFRGAGQILIGFGAIAMTKGAAKPFVLASWASGGASIIFGASNIFEGAHNLLLAWEWDTETQAFNPIRDTVFGGNQDVYDSANFWVSMFAMTMMVGGPTLPRSFKPIVFNPRVVNDISRRTGLTPDQVGDVIRHKRLSEKAFSENAFLERLNKGQSVHQILGVEAPINSSFHQLNTTVDTIELPKGTWDLGGSPRGFRIDEIAGNNLGSRFPVIDKIDSNGVATSIKSMDLRVSYQKPGRLESAIRADIRKVANFNGDRFGDVRVRPNQITGRQLQIVVPDITLTIGQIQAINNAIEYAKRYGVEVIITIGK